MDREYGQGCIRTSTSVSHTKHIIKDYQSIIP
jgi:hypothetical protein